ncbi:MAG: L,D-transpeptidase [Nitrospirota bacterium]|nr:L,D-transpeptidase [Nitrospirota bacterium]
MTEQGSGRPLAKRPSCWLATGTLLLLISLLFAWWQTPAFPPVFPSPIEELDRQIRAAGVTNLLPQEYAVFHQRVADLRHHWRLAANQWWPSWTLQEFTESYQQLMTSGGALLTATQHQKTALHSHLKNLLDAEQAQLTRLRNLNGLFDLKGKRTALSRAQSFLTQGASLLTQAQVDQVPHLLQQAQNTMRPIETLLIHQMSRYSDSHNIAKWNRWVADTIAPTRHSGELVMVVIKASQEFRLYQKGLLRQSFSTDLGFSGLQDKLHEGDGATPEGIFHIIQKKGKGETKFHKAFMLDFPTTLHQRQFRAAKAQGLIPAHRGIGGLIEIHGQPSGRSDPTNGCVALENSIMDRLFPLAPLRTPVVIVGALDPINFVSRALAPIQSHHTQRNSLTFFSPTESSHLSVG